MAGEETGSEQGPCNLAEGPSSGAGSTPGPEDEELEKQRES